MEEALRLGTDFDRELDQCVRGWMGETIQDAQCKFQRARSCLLMRRLLIGPHSREWIIGRLME